MNPQIQILLGDCLESLSYLSDRSVHCCVTSPPYFGLRDYGHEGQLGLEATPQAYVAKLVDVFREVHRVLRDDGTLWLNLGDSYGAAGGDIFSGFNERFHGARGRGGKQGQIIDSLKDLPPRDTGLRPKNLLGIPWRVAFALQADGWYLRQDIIWHKPNPMPESVRDRCTKAHEYLFLLSKLPKYYFDSDAFQEPAAASTYLRLAQDVENQHGSTRVPGKTNGPMKAVARRPRRTDSTRGSYVPDASAHGGLHREGDDREPLSRNRRSVWTVTTKPFKGAHFATFPPDLIEPCVLAGCPEGGTVLDPFGGAGTTGLVANKHGRRAVLCELNPEYAEMARVRIGETARVL